MSMEHWWNDADRRKPKYTEKSLSRCNIIYLRFCTDWPQIKLGLPHSEAGGLTVSAMVWCTYV